MVNIDGDARIVFDALQDIVASTLPDVWDVNIATYFTNNGSVKIAWKDLGTGYASIEWIERVLD